MFRPVMPQVQLSFATCVPPAAHIHALAIQIAHILDLFFAGPVCRAVQIPDHALPVAIGQDHKNEYYGRPGKNQHSALQNEFHRRGNPDNLWPVPHCKRTVANKAAEVQRITQGRSIAIYRADSGCCPEKDAECPQEPGAQNKPWPPAGIACFLMAVLGLHDMPRNRAGCTVQKTPHPWW